MSSVQKPTIDGFNEFLKTQKETPGECVMYYTHFDHEYEIVHNYVPVKDMPELTTETYRPRGNTALMDAIGRTIVKVGEDLAAKSEEERPSQVIFVIQTDGFENASTEYTKDKVSLMIKEQRDNWNWDFMFLGASEAAMHEAQAMGVPMATSLNYSQNAVGTQAAFAASGQNVSSARRSGQRVASYTSQQRKDADNNQP
jgi:hypothetical protein